MEMNSLCSSLYLRLGTSEAVFCRKKHWKCPRMICTFGSVIKGKNMFVRKERWKHSHTHTSRFNDRRCADARSLLTHYVLSRQHLRCLWINWSCNRWNLAVFPQLGRNHKRSLCKTNGSFFPQNQKMFSPHSRALSTIVKTKVHPRKGSEDFRIRIYMSPNNFCEI